MRGTMKKWMPIYYFGFSVAASLAFGSSGDPLEGPEFNRLLYAPHTLTED
jgi:hypothetical protein